DRHGDLARIAVYDLHEHEEEDILLLAYVLVDQAGTHARGLGDLFDRRPIEALAGEQLGGRRDNLRAAPPHELGILDDAGDLVCPHRLASWHPHVLTDYSINTTVKSRSFKGAATSRRASCLRRGRNGARRAICLPGGVSGHEDERVDQSERSRPDRH